MSGNWKRSAILIIFFVAVAVELKNFHTIMGPFRVNIKRITKCYDGPKANQGLEYFVRDVRTHHSQNPTLSGNVTLKFPINDSLEIRASLASWSAMGGWKENAYIIRLREACKIMDSIFGTMWTTFEVSMFGHTKTCPLLAGIYRFENVTVEMLKYPTKTFFYGRWRGDVMYFEKNGEEKSCFRCYVDTVAM